MNRNLLRTPLIKSASLLVVVSLLIYLTATSPEGTLWGSLGTLFLAAFRIVQLGLGLILSLLFCMIVLTGIFLGCVAMVSRESASKMLEQLRQDISDKLLWVRSLVIREPSPARAHAGEGLPSGIEEDVYAAMEGSLDLIRQDQDVADRNIEGLIERLDLLEQGQDVEHIIERLQSESEQREGLAGRVDQLQGQVRALEEKVDELVRLAREKPADPAAEGLEGRMDVMERDMVSLREDLARLRESTAAAPVKGESGAKTGRRDPSEHRLFAHIQNKAMQEKIEQLVSGTLDSNMSYAQVADHLVKQTSGKTAETIAAHPSLTREYIRYRRRNG